MPVLSWDKPKKVRTPEENANHAGFDGGPTGGYMPNMSPEDEKKWKAKITGQKLGYPQVEIRKSAQGSQMLLIVSLGRGYNYKYYRTEPSKGFPHIHNTTDSGINVHFSMNGPAMLSFAEMDELQQAVQEAREALEALEAK